MKKRTDVIQNTLLILLFAISSLNAQEVAEAGFLYLRGIDLAESEPIPLNGE